MSYYYSICKTKKSVTILWLILAICSPNSFGDNKNISSIYSPANTADIKQNIKYCDKQALVVWDVDGVLLMGSDRIFHSENIHRGLVHKHADDIAEKYKLNKEQKDLYTSNLFLQRPIMSVDEEIREIIRKLTKNEIKTIALTNAAAGKFGNIVSVEDWRLQELRSLGVSFEASFKDQTSFEFSELEKIHEHYPLFKQGVIFCNHHTKGEVLGAFLDRLSLKPSLIIFIDDSTKHLESVQAELKERNISYVGLHYTSAMDFPFEIEAKVVELQYENVIKNGFWLKDHEAINYLKENKK